MYIVTINYGHPTDPAAFDAHYEHTHLPLASKIPHVQAFAAGKNESPDGARPEQYLTAHVTFASREEALAALSSPEGQAASADIKELATGGASMSFTDCTVTVP